MSEGPCRLGNLDGVWWPIIDANGQEVCREPTFSQAVKAVSIINAAHAAGVEVGRKWAADRLLEILVERGVMPKAVADQIAEMRDWAE